MLKTRFICGQVIGAIALLTLLSCGSGDDEAQVATTDQDTVSTSAETDASGSAEADKPADEPITARDVTPPPAAKPKAEAKPKTETKTEPPPPPAPVMVTIPAGSSVTVALNTRIRTDSNAVGDPISATLASAVMAEGKTAIPAGSKLQGRLTEVEEPHRTKGKARLTLQFNEVVTPDGKTYAVSTAPLAFEAEGDKMSDEAKVGAGGLIGGAIGALTSKNKGKGAAIGAAIGAAAGGAVALATKGDQLELASGQQLSVEVTQATQVEVPK